VSFAAVLVGDEAAPDGEDELPQPAASVAEQEAQHVRRHLSQGYFGNILEIKFQFKLFEDL
jgi:hypothetical protein